MKKYICVTEDAYKLLVSPETKGKFEEKTMIQLNMSDEAIISKLKNYTIDNEEKKIRIIKPIFEENGQKVIDVSVLISVKDNQIVWNR
jgi:hypothetical protein